MLGAIAARGCGEAVTADDHVVRPATGSDLDAAAAIWHASAARMDGADPELPRLSDLRARVDAELAAGWSLFVAVDQERPTGMLALKPTEGLLDQLFVLPAMQGHGVGRRLLDEAKRRMPDGFQLRMAADNARARRFYQANGLILLRTDLHPRHGRPVEFHAWRGG